MSELATNRCPECGSQRAVSKEAAWDAASEIPPQAAREIERLRGVEGAAREMFVAFTREADQNTVRMMVPRDEFLRLADAAGLDLENLDDKEIAP